MISFDDFKKLDLRVAKILGVEKIENSVKLFRLEIDLGSEKRQIVSGIADAYSSEELLGKEVVVVANLEPKVIMGLESHGMLLAADNEGIPILITVEKEVSPGGKIT